MLPERYLDVHQHLWPAEFVDALRVRTAPPMLRGHTLHTAGEPPYEVDPVDHDPALRREQDCGAARVLVSLSSPLGIEDLPPEQAQPLLDAWHEGARRLPAPFGAWASVGHREPDLDGLKALLVESGGTAASAAVGSGGTPASAAVGGGGGGFAGLQIAATELATPAALERITPVLRRCEELDRPVLVHPGPARPAGGAPSWWPAVVDYPAQLQAAWWSWRHQGRRALPDLRICFVAGAGLAPVHHERFAVRAGAHLPVDRNAFVETSSYGRQGVDALIRALGIDVVVLGSDRPYAEPPLPPPAAPGSADSPTPATGPSGHDWHLGAAAAHAIRIVNPTRLLEGARP